MTQLHSLTMSSEKRNFSGLTLGSKKTRGSDEKDTNNPVSTKLKNFFRINSFSSGTVLGSDGLPTPKSESKATRSSRFLPSIGRNRSHTVASEGNALEEGMSPTAHANPYFAHQGPPVIRHHNPDSVPPSPPDTPKLQVNGASPSPDKATTAGREELARKLRRVASAPNAQGLFSKHADERPKTAEMGKEPVLLQNGSTPQLSMASPQPSGPLPLPKPNGKLALPGAIRNSVAFRRTYSSNSIKVGNVEVGPGSFDKIKLIGKGDVGKVYLVREKKSNRLYAMKGEYFLNGTAVYFFKLINL